MNKDLTKKDIRNCWITLSFVKDRTQDALEVHGEKLHPDFIQESKKRIKSYSLTIKKLEGMI